MEDGNVSNELLDLPKEFSRQNVESVSWISVIVYGTARKGRTKEKKIASSSEEFRENNRERELWATV